MYYLDSCICIDIMRGKVPNMYKIMRRMDHRQFAIPAIVKAELSVGVEKSHNPAKGATMLERFLQPYEIVPFDDACTAQYGKIRAQLEAAGRKIGPNDLLIAATAIAHGATLLTHNVREFSRVPWLQVEDWDEIEF